MRKILFFFVLLGAGVAYATSPEDYYNAGSDLFKNHDYEKAIQYFHAAIEQRPEYWQAYQSISMAYFQSGNRTEALVAIKESLRLHPDNRELRKFMETIIKTSPWVPAGTFWDKLPLVSILLSLLTLGWTFYSTSRYRTKGKDAPPRG